MERPLSSVSSECERVVLLRPGALGDALLTVPALALLRQHRPNAQVTLIARRDVLPLVTASRLAGVALPYDLPAWSALFGLDATSADPFTREVINGAHVVAWMSDTDGSVATNLSSLGAASVVICPSQPLPGDRTHMALRLVQALRPLGVPVPTTRDALAELLPPLRVPEAAVEAVGELWRELGLAETGTVVALHPGSGGAAKRWPPESFATLAAEIHVGGAQPLLIEGPQDREVCDAVTRTAHSRLPVVRDLSVARLAALLCRCSGYVGNDSGVSHLAGLLGLPALVLFGPTDPAVWSPIGPHVLVLRAPDSLLGNLAPVTVASALLDLLT